METAKYHLWKLLLTETTGTTETTETTERVASTYQQFTVGKLKYIFPDGICIINLKI